VKTVVHHHVAVDGGPDRHLELGPMLVGLDEVNGGGVVSSVHINTEPAARGTTSGASAVSLVGGQPSPRHGLRPGNQPPPRPPAPPAMRGAGFSKRHGKAY